MDPLKLEHFFNECDTDGSGIIDTDELIQMMSLLKQDVKHDAALLEAFHGVMEGTSAAEDNSNEAHENMDDANGRPCKETWKAKGHSPASTPSTGSPGKDTDSDKQHSQESYADALFDSKASVFDSKSLFDVALESAKDAAVPLPG